MWYLVELILYEWLIADILGQPWLFWAAVGIAVVLYILRGVAHGD